LLNHNGNTDKKIPLLTSICVVILTAVIAYIAYDQLKRLGDIAKNDFLLQIDERYSSPEIIEARSIINQYYIGAMYSKGKENKWVEKGCSDKK